MSKVTKIPCGILGAAFALELGDGTKYEILVREKTTVLRQILLCPVGHLFQNSWLQAADFARIYFPEAVVGSKVKLPAYEDYAQWARQRFSFILNEIKVQHINKWVLIASIIAGGLYLGLVEE